MSGLKTLNLRPVNGQDVQQLDDFRSKYWDADVEVPFGYFGEGVGTAVAEKGPVMVAALVGTKAVASIPGEDPHIATTFDLIKNPEASARDVAAAVLFLERTLACLAQSTGAVAGYVAVPSHLTEYIEYVKSCGYEESCQNCVILRRPFKPEVTPRLGDQRDKVTR